MSDFSAYFFDLGGTLVALDNDEVVCDQDGRITLLPEVEARLKDLAGQPVFVITNQAGVALGTLTEANARGFIEQVNQQVGGVVTDYRVCMHHPEAACVCRKPRPGMVLDLAAAYGMDLSNAVLVGDSDSDAQCALAAGIGTFIRAEVFFGRATQQQVTADLSIRLALSAHLPAIVAIYNASIPGHTATADLEPVSVDDREAWFAAHDPQRHPLWVAVERDEVVGWLSLSTYYNRPAWDPTVEVSFYVHPDRQRQGVGRALLYHALAAAPALGVSTILAVVSGHNVSSLRLLESAGFQRWGHLPEVVHMPEGRRDVMILGRHLDQAQ